MESQMLLSKLNFTSIPSIPTTTFRRHISAVNSSNRHHHSAFLRLCHLNFSVKSSNCNHNHHDHHHHHHNNESNSKLTKSQEALLSFAKATRWTDLAKFLRENLEMCCCSAVLFAAAAACPYLLPAPASVKPLQYLLTVIAFPLDPIDLLFGEDIFDDPVAAQHLPSLLISDSDDDDLTYLSRFLLSHPSDSLGLPGLLLLRQSFG